MTRPFFALRTWTCSCAALAAVSLAWPGTVARGGPAGAAATLGATATQESPLRLSLEDALRIAIGNDLGLQIQEAQTEGASYDAAGSWGAFDPVLTASASYDDSEFKATSQFSQVNVIKSESYAAAAGILFPLKTGGSFNLTFDLTNTQTNNKLQQSADEATTDNFQVEFRQPLLRGAGRGYATALQKEANLEYRRQVEGLRLARQNLVSTVENAYWDLVAALGQLEVAQTTLELGRQQLDQNQRRLDAGVGTQVEVLQAETNVAQREEQLLLRQTQVRSAADRLKAALYPGTQAETWDAEIAPTTPLPDAADQLERVPTWSAAVVVALERRGELRQQRLSIESSEVAVARASSERKPALDLSLTSRSRGFDDSASDAFESALGWEFPQNTAALTFSMPLGNRSAANAARKARTQLRTAQLTYEQLESQVVSEVREAVRQLAYASQAVIAADKSRELAERQLAAEQARYREGLSTNFQVLQFQQQLAEALFSSTNARANLAKAWTALAMAQGLLGEARP